MKLHTIFLKAWTSKLFGTLIVVNFTQSLRVIYCHLDSHMFSHFSKKRIHLCCALIYDDNSVNSSADDVILNNMRNIFNYYSKTQKYMCS